MTPNQQNNKTRAIINKQVHIVMAVFLLIVCWCVSVSAQADNVQSHTAPNDSRALAQLKVTPKPCVALRKGQTCYLEVTFKWQHPKVSDYCLINTTKRKTMKCWKQQTRGDYSFDFQSKQSNDFALRYQESATDIVRATIPVAWVYKSSKRAKSTWRLF